MFDIFRRHDEYIFCCKVILVVDKVSQLCKEKISNIKKTLNTITGYNIKLKDRHYSKLYSSKENYITE